MFTGVVLSGIILYGDVWVREGGERTLRGNRIHGERSFPPGPVVQSLLENHRHPSRRAALSSEEIQAKIRD